MARVFQIALHISEKDVFPALAAQGAGFQLAHVDVISGQQVQHRGKGTGLVRQGEEQGGFVRAGVAGHGSGRHAALAGLGRFGTDDHKTRPVAGLVLNAPGQHA